MRTETIILVCVLLATPMTACAQSATAPAAETIQLPDIRSPQSASSALTWLITITVLTVAPAIVILMTSFTRIIVVLGLLRMGLGTNQLPPNQVLFGLSLLMTLVIMAPVYSQVHADAVAPYLDGTMTANAAIDVGQKPVRAFMIAQIAAAGNDGDVRLFLKPETAAATDLTWDRVPTMSLLPGFVVSELKQAFWMGFRILLPFVIVDLLVGSVLVSMGMLMVPPALISLPMKLLLFVLADGWHLVIGQLMASFSAAAGAT